MNALKNLVRGLKGQVVSVALDNRDRDELEEALEAQGGPAPDPSATDDASAAAAAARLAAVRGGLEWCLRHYGGEECSSRRHHESVCAKTDAMLCFRWLMIQDERLSAHLQRCGVAHVRPADTRRPAAATSAAGAPAQTPSGPAPFLPHSRYSQRLLFMCVDLGNVHMLREILNRARGGGGGGGGGGTKGNGGGFTLMLGAAYRDVALPTDRNSSLAYSVHQYCEWYRDHPRPKDTPPMISARTAILQELERKEHEVLKDFHACCASPEAMHDAIVRGDLSLSFLTNQRRSLAMVICGFAAADSADARPSNDADAGAPSSAGDTIRLGMAPELARSVLDTFLKHDRRQNYAAVKQRDAYGNNVLHYCCASDQYLCIPLVLDTGYVNINAKNMDWIGDGAELLQRRKSGMEERRKRFSMAKKARDRKRIEKEEVELQRTPLNIALELRHERSVRALATWEPSDTAIHAHAVDEEGALVRAVPPHLRLDMRWGRCIHAAVVDNSMCEILWHLLYAGIEYHEEDEVTLQYPLDVATPANLDMIKTYERSMKLLEMAAEPGARSFESLKSHLQQQDIRFVKNADGDNVLHVAVRTFRKMYARELNLLINLDTPLVAKCKAERNKQRETPLELLVRLGQEDNAGEAAAGGLSSDSYALTESMVYAARHNEASVLRKRLAENGGLETLQLLVDFDDYDLLQIACRHNSVDCVALLIKAGWNPLRAHPTTHETALHVAARHRSVQSIVALVADIRKPGGRECADDEPQVSLHELVAAVTVDKQTPLHIACAMLAEEMRDKASSVMDVFKEIDEWGKAKFRKLKAQSEGDETMRSIHDSQDGQRNLKVQNAVHNLSAGEECPIEFRNTEVVALLLTLSSDLNVRDAAGHTPAQLIPSSMPFPPVASESAEMRMLRQSLEMPKFIAEADDADKRKRLEEFHVRLMVDITGTLIARLVQADTFDLHEKGRAFLEMLNKARSANMQVVIDYIRGIAKKMHSADEDVRREGELDKKQILEGFEAPDGRKPIEIAAADASMYPVVQALLECEVRFSREHVQSSNEETRASLLRYIAGRELMEHCAASRWGCVSELLRAELAAARARHPVLVEGSREEIERSRRRQRTEVRREMKRIVSFTSSRNETLLHTLAQRGDKGVDKETIRQLLQHGVPVDARLPRDGRDYGGCTALEIALQTYKGFLDLVEVLLEFGADPTPIREVMEKYGTSSEERHRTLRRALQQRSIVNQADNISYNRRIRKCLEGYQENTQELIASLRGIITNIKNFVHQDVESMSRFMKMGTEFCFSETWDAILNTPTDYESPLQFAIKKKFLASAQILLEQGADPEPALEMIEENPEEYAVPEELNALMVECFEKRLWFNAIEECDVEEVRRYKEEERDQFLKHLRSRTRYAYTTLHMLAEKKREQWEAAMEIAHLIEDGLDTSDYDAIDLDNDTALNMAARNGFVEMVKFLISKHVDLGVTGTMGCSALTLSLDPYDSKLDNGPVTRLLVEANAPAIGRVYEYDPLWLPILRDSFEAFSALLSIYSEAQVNAKEPRHGWTALHIAVVTSRRHFAQKLLERGADVDACGYAGHTPLFVAVRKRNADLARLLLQEGADPMARCVPKGWSDTGATGFVQTLEWLENVDTNDTAGLSITPYQYAKDYWSSESDPILFNLLARYKSRSELLNAIKDADPYKAREINVLRRQMNTIYKRCFGISRSGAPVQEGMHDRDSREFFATVLNDALMAAVRANWADAGRLCYEMGADVTRAELVEEAQNLSNDSYLALLKLWGDHAIMLKRLADSKETIAEEEVLRWNEQGILFQALHSGTALHMLATRGPAQRLQLLLAQSTIEQMNEQNMSDQQTPLHCAVEAQQLECVRVLLSNPRVRMDLTDRKKRTAREIAANTPALVAVFDEMEEKGRTKVLCREWSEKQAKTFAVMQRMVAKADSRRVERARLEMESSERSTARADTMRPGDASPLKIDIRLNEDRSATSAVPAHSTVSSISSAEAEREDVNLEKLEELRAAMSAHWRVKIPSDCNSVDLLQSLLCDAISLRLPLVPKVAAGTLFPPAGYEQGDGRGGERMQRQVVQQVDMWYYTSDEAIEGEEGLDRARHKINTNQDVADFMEAVESAEASGRGRVVLNYSIDRSSVALEEVSDDPSTLGMGTTMSTAEKKEQERNSKLTDKAIDNIIEDLVPEKRWHFGFVSDAPCLLDVADHLKRCRRWWPLLAKECGMSDQEVRLITEQSGFPELQFLRGLRAQQFPISLFIRAIVSAHKKEENAVWALIYWEIKADLSGKVPDELKLLRQQFKRQHSGGGSGSGSAAASGRAAGDDDATAVLKKLTVKMIPWSELQIEERIGTGASAVVFKAMLRGNPVAVKRLHSVRWPKNPQDAPPEVIALLRDLAFGLSVRHPHVVSYLGVTSPDLAAPSPELCIVMEYMVHASADLLIADPAQVLTPRQRLRLCADAASGLAHLHEHGVIHRDVKPANMMVTGAMRCKIGDFGVSRPPDNARSMTGFVGTPQYMAPEVMIDGARYDAKVDVYSFAMSVYTIYTGEKPFPKQAVQKVYELVSAGRRPSVDGLPPELASLLSDCWAASPAARPDMADVTKRMDVALKAAPSIAMQLVNSNPNIPKIAWAEVTEGEQIGSGAHGVVCRGEWHGRAIAIKRLHHVQWTVPSGPGAPDVSPEMRLFLEEIATCAQVKHRNIVEFLGVASPDGQSLCLITEFMRFGSVDRMLRTGTYSLAARLKLCLGAARGIAHLHANKIMHRDIKPGNLLVSEHMVCKICDFGIATAMPDRARTMTQVGTPVYMAPEVLAESTRYAAPAESHSFGITMWEILTGEQAFAECSSIMAACQTVSRGDRPSTASLPEPVGALLAKCWAPKPAERPSFPKIVSEIERILSTFSASGEDML